MKNLKLRSEEETFSLMYKKEAKKITTDCLKVNREDKIMKT